MTQAEALDLLQSRRLTIDPRTIMFMLVGANLVALSPHSPQPLVYALLVMVVILLATTNRRTFTVGFTVATLIFAGLSSLAHTSITNPVIVVVIFLSYYLLRFAVVFGTGSYLFFTTQPTELIAALRTLHFPNFLLIPLAVMLRFLPTIAKEGRHIMESMKIRHIFPTTASALIHPIKAVEYLVVPLISSSLRIGEDLSASALLRNLGGHKHPTSIAVLGFRLPDALVIAYTLAVLVAWIAWGLPWL